MMRTRRPAREAAIDVLRQLRGAGFTALLAGGCVRDMLLGREPKDFDVATDARPEDVVRCFPRARLVGAKFGVVLVRRFGHDVEVATFRTDGVYIDGRRPESVSFGTQEQDARRRDFTINGMFLDPEGDRVIDHVGGQADLAARVLRTIGDPNHRFAEDHLRMLRAVRLAAALDFRIDPATLDAIRSHAPQLRQISPERVWMELERILAAPSRGRGWELLFSTGLRAHLAVCWHCDADDDVRVMHLLAALPPRELPVPLPLAAALGRCTRAEVDAIADGLRLSNELRDRTQWLIESLPSALNAGEVELADLKLLMACADWPLLVDLIAAQVQAGVTPQAALDTLRARAERVPPDAVAPPPLLSGHDLAGMGIPEGRLVGVILRAVYRAQLNERIQSREDAEQMARELAAVS